MARPLRLVGLLGLGLMLLGAHELHGRAERVRAELYEEDLLYLPRPQALAPLLLGHRELGADLLFIRAAIYAGSAMATRRDARWLDQYLDSIVALDPRWKMPYRWAGTVTMYNGRPITNESVGASSHFLELGVHQFPDDWELAFMLGCNYLFELKSDRAEERTAWRRTGAEWIRHAALLGGGPPWVPLLAATIYRQEGQNEAALHHLEEVYLATDDPATRIEVENRLRSLHARLDWGRAQRERQAFEAAWRRDLPFVPADFFVIVGRRAPARLDRAALLNHYESAYDDDSDDGAL